jgi:Phage lysozyme
MVVARSFYYQGVSRMTPEGKTRLINDEGCILYVYDDATELPIKKLPTGGNPTVGIGRNLASRGITSAEAMFLLNNDIAVEETKLTAAISWFATIHPVWQDALIMISFNTGNVLSWLRLLQAMENGDAALASNQVLDSGAARELPARYGRIAKAVADRAWPTNG